MHQKTGGLPKAGEWVFGGQNASMSNAAFNIFGAKNVTM